ncbi:TKL family protein kinase [Tritrichomonas foetus]|uniref:TKL family protein kinase n=1 Tax=Tritrichomonas foetus TaxID=1144522 RepID=A0A1J4KHH8_9EUKA|nr:TKL family protein kinase [Tritrichomonas foetus]|eukprot:OHT09284.1 TKL family protein kinase [Tritrichomonas foetus]
MKKRLGSFRIRNMDPLDEDGPHFENVHARRIQITMQLVNKYPQYIRDISDFQFDKRIGKGGYGEVWLANDLRTGKMVAIKELYTKTLFGKHLSSFVREIHTMINLQLPFVVPFVGYTIEPPYSIITEYMPNGSLFYYINKSKRKFQLSGTHSTIIALCVAGGMHICHSRHIIHRDLKSANIFLDANRFPVIADFGVARYFKDDNKDKSENQKGGRQNIIIDSNKTRKMTPRCGTYTHMAPEIMTGDDYGLKCDVYSYGMILYEMVDGRNPFGKIVGKDLLNHVSKENLRPKIRSKRISTSLRDLIENCWSSNIKKRPTFLEIFHDFQSGKISFPDTDVKAVSDFAEKIYDTIIDPSSIIVDDPKISVDYQSILIRMQGKIKKILESEEEEEEEYEKCNDDKDGQYSNSFESIEQDSKFTEKFGNKTLIDILNNPKDENFCLLLDFLSVNIDETQYVSLYQQLSQYFRCETDPIVLKAIIQTYRKIGKRNHKFYLFLQQYHFSTILPLSNELRVETFYFLGDIFCYTPSTISGGVKRSIASLIMNTPEYALQLFSLYASKFKQIYDPFPTLDILITYARAFLNNDTGAKFIDILYYLVINNTDYRIQRIQKVRHVLWAFCKSKSISTTKTATNAIIALFHLFDKSIILPFDVLCRNLTNRKLVDCSLSLLLLSQKYPISRTLARVLIDCCQSKKVAFSILLKYASQEEKTALIVSKNTKWMLSNHISAMKLFMICFSFQNARIEILKSLLFYDFLARQAKYGDNDVLIAIPSLLKRITLNSIMIKQLEQHLFFRNYHDSIIQSENIMVKNAANTMLDHFAKTIYSPEYSIFIPFLIQNLQLKNELTTGSIVVITTLSRYPELASIFKNSNLITYFQSLRNIPSLKSKAETFIQNIENLDL